MKVLNTTGSTESIYWSGQSYEVMKVEVDISRGIFAYNIVGLADKSTKESKFRILSALKNTNFDLPQRKNQKVTVSLLPSNKRKLESYADLAIAYSYLLASNQIIKFDYRVCCIGEIDLEGNIYSKQDIVHLIRVATDAGINKFILPKNSTSNFSLLPNIEVMEISKLSDLKSNIKFTPIIGWNTKIDNAEEKFTQFKISEPNTDEETLEKSNIFMIDSLYGIDIQKRALQIALVGNHHIIFSGMPGCGKSELASSAIELLDPLTPSEALEKHSLESRVYPNLQYNPLTTKRSLRKPHTSIEVSGLIGSIRNNLGEIHLANHGILLLNELCEFPKKTLEALRDPIESQYLLVHKNNLIQKTELKFIVVATTNICPCGRIPLSYIDQYSIVNLENKENIFCYCSTKQILNYRNKISAPFEDRFPIICNFKYEDMNNNTKTQNFDPHIVKHRHTPFKQKTLSGKNIKESIIRSRETSRTRNSGKYNQQLSYKDIENMGIDDTGIKSIQDIENICKLSKRKITNTLRVARSIADLNSSEKINSEHILEAYGYTRNTIFGI